MKQIIRITVFLIIAVNLFAQTMPVSGDDEKMPAAIPITEITSRADQTQGEFQRLQKDLKPSATVTGIQNDLTTVLDSLDRLSNDKMFTQLDNLELRVVSSLKQEWTLYNTRLEEWKNILLQETQKVEKIGREIKAMSALWQVSRENAITEKAPLAIRERINSILKDITEIAVQSSKYLNELLIMQNSISEQQIKINELIKKIGKTEQNLRGSLFVQDNPPLWQAFQVTDDTLKIAEQFHNSWRELLRSNMTFFEVNKQHLYLHIIILILLISVMVYLYLKNKREQLFDEEDTTLKNSAYFISKPISAAILIALFLSVWIYPERSATVGEFIILLMVIPVVRLTPGIIPKELQRPVYILAFLYLLDTLQKSALGFVLVQRLILLCATAVGLGILIWLFRERKSIDLQNKSLIPRFFWKILPFALIFPVVSLLANLYGSVNLAATLGWGMVESLYLLVIVYISATVASGILTVLIRRRRKKALQFIRTYAHKVEHWAKFVINAAALLVWFRATVRSFGLWEPLIIWYESILAHEWIIGTTVISLNAIVDFVLVIIMVFLITRIVRIFLDMEVFPRLRLPKGIPAAVSMMVRYILITLGIFLAISSLGIDLGKISLLAGALGVGLGFGLQKIVANFISSLILAFGRAIRVGDTVKYNDIFGNVREIGVNATTVKTFEGSDVIIPNSDLISNQVTNWTLSDVMRRMELPVKVAFDSDPHQVLKILEKVARGHPKVLDKPVPFAVFNGFGDNYLDFTLYYWITSTLFFEAKTEVALKVYDKIRAEGIHTPRPQRDLRLTVNGDQQTTRSIARKVKRQQVENKPSKKSTASKRT